MEEATWEHEDTMRATYPFLFKDEGRYLNNYCICMRLKGYVCNFGDEFFFNGGGM